MRAAPEGRAKDALGVEGVRVDVDVRGSGSGGETDAGGVADVKVIGACAWVCVRRSGAEGIDVVRVG